MEKKPIYKQIRDTVDAHLPGTRIVLFGSQARGDAGKDSDYDLLIITPEKLSHKEKIGWLSKLNRILVYSIDVSFDLLMNSEEEVRSKCALPGHVIKTAIAEGIAI